jgi:hypothetical protein
MAKNDVLEEKEVVPCCLENKRLIIKFHPKPRGFITNPKHILYGGMMEGAIRVLPAPIHRNGDYKNVLTNDEKAYLEDHMGLGKDGLSIYKKTDNYWDNVKVKLEKGENYFDMNSPEDYIKAKVAIAHDNVVAKSFDEINYKVSTMFYVVKEGEKDQESHRKLTAKQEAYKLYGKIEDERDVLDYICKAVKGSTVTKATKLSVVQGWIGDIIENNTKEFLLVGSDKQLRTKMIIDQGVTCGAVRFMDGQYFTAEGKPLALNSEANLQNAANYLDMPINQPIRLKIETRNKIAE